MVLAVSLCVSTRYGDDVVLAVCLSVSVPGMEMIWFWLCLCVSTRYGDDVVLAVSLSVLVPGMKMMWFWLCISLCQYPVWR